MWFGTQVPPLWHGEEEQGDWNKITNTWPMTRLFLALCFRLKIVFLFAIHHKEQDGDWYIYLWCFAHENSKRAYKNTKKYKPFILDKSNAVSVGTIAMKPYLSICLVGSVWFARYCGKMYNRHLISYGLDYELEIARGRAEDSWKFCIRIMWMILIRKKCQAS